MVLPAVIGAGIGGLAGLIGGNKKPEVDPYGGFTPEQARLSKLLGGRLSDVVSQGPNYYQGQLSSPMTPGEQNNIDQYNNFASTGYNTVNKLANYNDTDFNNQFQTEIADPSLQYFKSYLQPQIEESLPSFSTARGNAVGRGVQDLSNSLLTQRFSARESAKDRALNAVGQGQSLGVTGAQINAIPREIEQAGLDRAYDNFVQGNQQYGQDISSALGFLGISSVTERQPQPSAFERALGGAYAGAQLGSLVNGLQNQQKPYMDLGGVKYGGQGAYTTPPFNPGY